MSLSVSFGSFQRAFHHCTEMISSSLDSLVLKAARKCIFFGHKTVNEKMQREWEEYLSTKEFKILEFECRDENGQLVDTTLLSADNEDANRNIVIFCLNGSYQNVRKKIVPFLKNGMDVLLWNPKNPIQSTTYANTLTSVLRAVRSQRKEAKIVVKSYCASSDPAISAVADLNDPRIDLIVDRGFGDLKKLARSMSCLVSFSIFQRALDQFSCDGIKKIAKIRGKVLYLTCPNDQLMNYGKKENFTVDLSKKKEGRVIELKDHHHWSNWGNDIHNQVFSWLKESGTIDAFTPMRRKKLPKLSKWQTVILPHLIKTKC